MEVQQKIFAPTPKKNLQRNSPKSKEFECENSVDSSKNFMFSRKSLNFTNIDFESGRNSTSTRETIISEEELNFEKELSQEFEKLSINSELLEILKPQRMHSSVLEKKASPFLTENNTSGSLTPTFSKSRPPRCANPFSRNFEKENTLKFPNSS